MADHMSSYCLLGLIRLNVTISDRQTTLPRDDDKCPYVATLYDHSLTEA